MNTPPLPPTTPPAFDAPDLAQQVEALPPERVHELPFGAIRVDAAHRVSFYSRRESEQSGRGALPAEGLDFFRTLAPCMDTPLVRGRIDAALAAGTLDVRLRHVGDFSDRSRALELRAVSAHAPHGSGGGFWLFVKRV